MTITADKLLFRYSGGVANSDPDNSLGGVMSTAPAGVISSAELDNLFDGVTAVESLYGAIHFRGLYIENAHATDVWRTVVVWIDGPTSAPGTDLAVGLAAESVGVPMGSIANDALIPPGVTFASPVHKRDALMVGDIPAGSFRGIWLRRTVLQNAEPAADLGSLRCEGNAA